jgi:O-antigen ligase
VGTVCLLPLAITSATVDVTMVPRFLVLALGVLLISLFSILQKDKTPIFLSRTLAFPLLLLTGWIALSIIWSPVKSEALFDTLRWSLGVSFAFLAGSFLQKNLLLFFQAATLIGLGLSMLSLLQVAGIATDWVAPFNTIPTGTMGNANLNAEVLLLLCAFSVALIFTGSKIWKGIAAASMLLSGAVIYQTNSVAVWLGAGVATLIFMLCVPVILRKKHSDETKPAFWMRRGIVPILLFIPMIAGIVAVVGTEKFQIWKKPVIAALNAENPRITRGEGSTVERLILWRQSVELMKERPFTGYGISSWRFESGRKGIAGYYDTFGTRFYLAPHNDYLSFAAELGVPGLIFYLFLLISMTVCAMHLLWRTPDFFTTWTMAAMLFGIAAWCTISMFGFPKDRVFHLVLFFSMVAVIGVLHEKNKEPRASHGLFPVGSLIMAGIAILSLVCGGFRYSGESHAQKILQYKSEGDWAGVEVEAKKACNLFYRVESGSAMPIAWYEGVVLLAKGDNAGGLLKLQEAHMIHPWHPHVMNNLGTALALNGDWKGSETQFAETHYVYPDFEDAALNYIDVLIHNGKLARADSVFSSRVFLIGTDRIKGIKARLRNEPLISPKP